MKSLPDIRGLGAAWRGLRSRHDATVRPSRLSPGYLARCVLLLAICLALAPAGRARAGNTTITFDDLPVGTPLTSQYHTLGVDFAPTPPSPYPVISQTAYASSGTQVANMGGRCGTEFCGNGGIKAHFTSCHAQVQLHVGSLQLQQETGFEPNAMDLFAYDKDGNVVGQASGDTTPHFGTVLSVTSPAANIYSFTVRPHGGVVGPGWNLGIDDLSFDAPNAACAPYYVLTSSAYPPPTTITLGGTPPLAVTRGGTATTTFLAHRSAGWTDTITFGASAVPRVTASFSPPSVAGPGDSMVTLTLAADAQAPVGTTKMTITGMSTTTSAQALAQPLVIPVLVRGLLADARVTGIEVTQGIQLPALDERGGAMGNVVPYHGIRLIQGGVTVARVFADSRDLGPAGTVSPPPSLRLSGADSGGQALPGSPLSPEFAPHSLPLEATDFVSEGQRIDPAGAYVFTLPASWSVPGLSLTAQLDPGTPGSATQCSDDPQCASNNSFTLSGITFVPGGQLTIEPVELRVNDTPMADPAGIFAPAINLLPAAQGNAVVTNYGGMVDISGIESSSAAAQATACTDPTTKACKDIWGDSADKAWLALSNFMDNAAPSGAFSDPATVPGQVVIGVYPQQYAAAGTVGAESNNYNGRSMAIVTGCDTATVPCTPYRPLSADAHELGHALGREHASGCNGGGSNGQVAEGWPNDEKGYIQGVGLDARPGSGGASGPYRILAYTYGQPIYDFMSYCAQVGSGETDDWISVPGWNEEIDSQPWLPPFSKTTTTFSTPAGRVASLRVADADPRLLVRGFLDHAGKVVVTEVEPLLPGVTVPLPAAQAPIFSTAGYRIVTRDAHGARLADMPVDATRSHVDGNGRGIPGSGTTLLYAVVPASGAASLSIVQHGTTLFQRVAPPHIPGVAIVAPAAGATVGRAPALTPSVGTPPSTVKVAWQTTDPDSVPRMAMVDYSADGGTTWRPVYLGPDKGGADLSSTYFAGSRAARIRVRVNDGFHEGMAVSGVFVALGAPPTVRIDSPVAGAHGTLLTDFSLRGTAFDDADRPLRGRSLAWSVDGRQVGSGGQVTVSSLGYGTHQVRLQATDAGGRTGSAVVSVTVCCKLTLAR